MLKSYYLDCDFLYGTLIEMLNWIERLKNISLISNQSSNLQVFKLLNYVYNLVFTIFIHRFFLNIEFNAN